MASSDLPDLRHLTAMVEAITETLPVRRFYWPRCQVHGNHDATYEILGAGFMGYGCAEVATSELYYAESNPAQYGRKAPQIKKLVGGGS